MAVGKTFSMAHAKLPDAVSAARAPFTGFMLDGGLPVASTLNPGRQVEGDNLVSPNLSRRFVRSSVVTSQPWLSAICATPAPAPPPGVAPPPGLGAKGPRVPIGGRRSAWTVEVPLHSSYSATVPVHTTASSRPRDVSPRHVRRRVESSTMRLAVTGRATPSPERMPTSPARLSATPSPLWPPEQVQLQRLGSPLRFQGCPVAAPATMPVATSAQVMATTTMRHDGYPLSTPPMVSTTFSGDSYQPSFIFSGVNPPTRYVSQATQPGERLGFQAQMVEPEFAFSAPARNVNKRRSAWDSAALRDGDSPRPLAALATKKPLVSRVGSPKSARGQLTVSLSVGDLSQRREAAPRQPAAMHTPATLPRTPQLSDGPGTVICFGDSLTMGSRDTGHSYPGVLESLLKGAGHNLTVKNEGIWGDTSTEMQTRLPRVIAEHARSGRVAFILILAGTNDILRRFGTTSQIVARVRQLHSIAGNAPYMPQVGILTLPPLKAATDAKNSLLEVNTGLRKACAQQVGLQRPFLVELESVDVNLSTDGVHFADSGYSDFALRAFEAMKPLLAKQQQLIASTPCRHG
mmetsp:Transcript_27000/g.77323  ORF Transcript_27000/g.77323 Transcript_27000/m.77323 type:complete len:575 (+) Transcript_27000:93-1817(+)